MSKKKKQKYYAIKEGKGVKNKIHGQSARNLY